MMPSFRLIRLTHLLLLIILCVYILEVGRPLLMPMAFGVLLAFLLRPLVENLERRLGNLALSILIAFVLALVPIGLLSWFFSHEISHMIRNLGNIDARLHAGLDKFLDLSSTFSGLPPIDEKLWINQQLTGFLNRSFGVLTKILASSTSVFAEFLVSLILAFFLLYYRRPFEEFVLLQFPDHHRVEVASAMKATQDISRKYIYGLAILTFLLSILFTIGLWIIGIPYAPFWGMLMATMNIIPFIGNLIGLAFLLLFGLASTGNVSSIIFILILHIVIQTVEGNVLRPLIVGNTVNVNAFVAIISILLGGFIWGVGGILLALPFMAMFKVICDHLDPLKPLGALLDANISTKGELLEKFDDERFRFNTYLNRKG